jgi:GAF domain-containing protein
VADPRLTDGLELGRLAEEQATLRRVATLVARGAPPAELFEAVIGELGRLVCADAAALSRFEADDTLTTIGFWGKADGYRSAGTRHPVGAGTLARLILDSRGPSRVDSYAQAHGSLADEVRDRGWRSAVGSPVVVAGRLWGVIAVASTTDQALPLDTEGRLAQFTELLATAVANAQGREDLTRLAEEQAALRRVATLVARGAPPDSVFAVVAEQVSRVLQVPLVSIVHYEPDGTATERASVSGRGELFPVGTRWPLDGTSVVSLVGDTGRPARINDYSEVAGTIADAVRRVGIRSTVGIPIAVAGRLWGTMVASSEDPEPLPADIEARLAKFTELVATAISNSEAQAEVARLADEQAALRRVATLVAEGVSPDELFHAATQEVGRLLGADSAGMVRYDAGDLVTVVGSWAAEGEHAPVARQWPIGDSTLSPIILRTGRPARRDDWSNARGLIADFVRDELGIRSSVGCPIVLERRVWGALIVHSKRVQPLPADTESKVAAFTELVATAISNAEARSEAGRLAHEQAALRRVATLVAHESPPAQVFAAVAEEVGRLLGVDDTRLVRYEPNGTVTALASWGKLADAVAVGANARPERTTVTSLVLESASDARVDDYTSAEGPTAYLRHLGIRSTVGTPIVVQGRVWGAMLVGSLKEEPLPADTEPRVREFTELVATAIGNVQARADLARSRARIVEAADEERRRVVRDLHDGAQQRLVHTVITLKLADRALRQPEADAGVLITEALQHAERATDELRELSHGILPAVLTRGGLRAGVAALATRMPVPIDHVVDVGRLPPAIEATAYFVVAEALTNVAKHSRAQRAEVTARVQDGTLQIEVRDDGVGGARADGSGLLGLGDRLDALDGRLRVESPAGGGTVIAAAIPLAGHLR